MTNSRHIAILSLAVTVLAIAGCAVPAPIYVAPRMPFPVDEYAKLATTGTSTVSGTATIERYNIEVTNPRDPVHNFMLLPITSYSKQAYDTVYTSCHRIAEPDPRQEAYVRRLPPVRNGSFTASFEFKNVPPGDYWLMDRAIYKVSGPSPVQTVDGVTDSGIGFRVRLKRIKVEEGKDITNIALQTPKDERHGGQSCFTLK